MARSKYKVADMSTLPQGNRPVDPMEQEEISTLETEVQTDVQAVEESEEKTTKHRGQQGRSKRYQSAIGTIDRTKLYPITKAVEMLKALPQPKFDQSVEVHLSFKDVMSNVEVAYPHSTGKTVRVAVFSDELTAELDKGVVNFDVLLAAPAQMSKLTKYARLLGPKGLMPNPKNGTLTADTAKRQKELESGKISVRGEKKAPLLHTTIGKISMDATALAENFTALVTACGQGKVLKATICTSMSPGVKIQLI